MGNDTHRHCQLAQPSRCRRGYVASMILWSCAGGGSLQNCYRRQGVKEGRAPAPTRHLKYTSGSKFASSGHPKRAFNFQDQTLNSVKTQAGTSKSLDQRPLRSRSKDLNPVVKHVGYVDSTLRVQCDSCQRLETCVHWKEGGKAGKLKHPLLCTEITPLGE